MEYYPHNKIRLVETDKERDSKTKRFIRSTITATSSKSRQIGKGMSCSYFFRYVSDDGTPTGIDHYSEVIDIAEAEGLIVSTSQQKVKVKEKLECRRTELRKKLVDDPELLQELYSDVTNIVTERMGNTKFIEEGDENEEAIPDDDKATRGSARKASRKVSKRKNTAR